MASGKELKISASMDQASFQATQRALAEMTKQAQLLAKALQGVGMPGSSGGGVFSGGGVSGGNAAGSRGSSPTASIAQGINANVNVFKNMATLGTASLKGLTDALKTSTQQQQTQLNNLKRSLEALGDTYDKLGGKGQRATAVQAKMFQVAGMVQSAQDNLTALQAAGPASNLLPGVGPPGARMLPGARSGLPGMPTGLAGAAWQFGNGNIGAGLMTPIGPGAVSPQGLLQSLLGSGAGAMALRVGGYAAAGLTGLVNGSQAFNNMMLDTTSSRGRTMAGSYQAMRRTDISDALAERHLMNSMSQQEREEVMRSVFSKEEVAKGWISGGWDMLTSAGSEASKLTPVEQETMRAGKREAMLQKVKQSSKYIVNEQQANDYLEETRGARLQAQRILGVGFNRTKDAAGRPTWTDFGAYDAGLHRIGYSTGEEASAQLQLQGQAGEQFARLHRRRVMGAAGKGYDISPLLTAAGRGGGDAVGLAQAAMGGGISTAAGIQLGNSIFGFDPRGTVTGAGALQAIQQGFTFTGGVGDMNQVARAQLGMQSLDRTTTGFDQFQKGMNLASAIKAMPGGSTYSQDSLAKAGFKELAEVAMGGSTINSRAWGWGASEAKAQMGGSLHGVFARYAEQGDTKPAGRAMRAMRASGLGEFGYIQKRGADAKRGDKSAAAELEALSAVYTRESGDSAEAGLGAITAASGFAVGGGLKKGPLPWGGMSDDEKAKRVAEAKQKEESGAKTTENLDKIIDSLDKNMERLGKVGTFMTTLSMGADVAALSLYKLAGASDAAVAKMAEEMGKSTVEQATGFNLNQSPYDKERAALNKRMAEFIAAKQQKAGAKKE